MMEDYNGSRYNPLQWRAHAEPNGYNQDKPRKHKDKKDKKKKRQEKPPPAFYHGMPYDYYLPHQVEPHAVPPKEMLVYPSSSGNGNYWPDTLPPPQGKSRKSKNEEKPRKTNGVPAYFGFNQPMNGNHFNLIYEGVPRPGEVERNKSYVNGRNAMAQPPLPKQPMGEPPSRPTKGLPRTYFFEEPPGNPTYATTITRTAQEQAEPMGDVPGFVYYRGQGNVRDEYSRSIKPEPAPPVNEGKHSIDPESVLQEFDAKLAEFDSVASFPTNNKGPPSHHETATLEDNRPNLDKRKEFLDRELTRIYGPSQRKPAYIIPKPVPVVMKAQTSTPNDTPRDVPPLNITNVDSVVNQVREERPVPIHDQEKSYDFTDNQSVASLDDLDTSKVNESETVVETSTESEPTTVASAIGGMPDQQETFKKHRESEEPVMMSLELNGSEEAQKNDDNAPKPFFSDEFLTAELVSQIPEPVPSGSEAPKIPVAPPTPSLAVEKTAIPSKEKTKPSKKEELLSKEVNNPPVVKVLEAQMVSRIPDEVMMTKSAEPNVPKAPVSEQGDTSDAYDKYCDGNEHCKIVPEEVQLYYPEKNEDGSLNLLNSKPESPTGEPVATTSASSNPSDESKINQIISDVTKNQPQPVSQIGHVGPPKTPKRNIIEKYINGGQQFSLGLEHDAPPNPKVDLLNLKPSNWQPLN